VILSSESNGRLDIVNLLLQRTNRFVVREFFILLMITNGELAGASVENHALLDCGCTWTPSVSFILLRGSRRLSWLGQASRRSICKGQQRMCNAARAMRV